MESIVISDLPYITEIDRCDGRRCDICSSVKYQRKYGSNGFRGCTSSISTVKYIPYTNNMKVINRNFELVTQQNSDLKQQIEVLNIEIKKNNDLIQELKNNSISLEKELKVTRNHMIDMGNAMTVFEDSIKNLSDKMSHILSFIPIFVQKTTQIFVRLWAGIKTNTEIEFEELTYTDIPLLNQIHQIHQ